MGNLALAVNDSTLNKIEAEKFLNQPKTLGVLSITVRYQLSYRNYLAIEIADIRLIYEHSPMP